MHPEAGEHRWLCAAACIMRCIMWSNGRNSDLLLGRSSVQVLPRRTAGAESPALQSPIPRHFCAAAAAWHHLSPSFLGMAFLTETLDRVPSPMAGHVSAKLFSVRVEMTLNYRFWQHFGIAGRELCLNFRVSFWHLSVECFGLIFTGFLTNLFNCINI